MLENLSGRRVLLLPLQQEVFRIRPERQEERERDDVGHRFQARAPVTRSEPGRSAAECVLRRPKFHVHDAEFPINMEPLAQ